MIKNPDLLKKLEDEFIRNESRLNYRQSLKLFTDMWEEGVRLGILPPKDPLEGLEVDIKIAKVLNSCLKNSSQK